MSALIPKYTIKNSKQLICVYKHTNCGVCFYVGSGSLSRAFCVQNRKQRWMEYVSCLSSFDVEIVGLFHSRNEAEDLEKILIEKLSPKCNIVYNSKYKQKRKQLSENHKQKLRVSGKARKVLHVETGEVFPSAKAASRHFSLSRTYASEVARGIRAPISGLTFMYVENLRQ